ncbi:MAG TPA: ice-binding family protein [bacterium]
MKKLIGCLIVMTLLPVALMVGCKNAPASPACPDTPTVTRTLTPTVTPTGTITSTITNTATNSPTGTPTATATNSPTVTPTDTATNSPTVTSTATAQTAQATINPGTTSNYVLLSHTGITNSGPTTTCGGYESDSPSVVGSPAIVENCGGAIDIANGTGSIAHTDLTAAYTDAQSRTGATLAPGGDLGGQTLYPGCYTISSDMNISQADLTLDALGDPNAVFIFQTKSGGNLVVGPGRQIILAGSAQAANVWWAISGYCSLDTTVQMKGIIMAQTSVTFNTGATLIGRALAMTGDITLLTNNIMHP